MNFITILLGVMLGLNIFAVLLIIKQLFFDDSKRKELLGSKESPAVDSKRFIASASRLHFENNDKKQRNG